MSRLPDTVNLFGRKTYLLNFPQLLLQLLYLLVLDDVLLAALCLLLKFGQGCNPHLVVLLLLRSECDVKGQRLDLKHVLAAVGGL